MIRLRSSSAATGAVESIHTEYVLHTPLGDLTAHYTENDGVHTVWRHDLLIKTDDDMDRFLAAPFVPAPPDVAAFERTRQALGERGVMEIEMPDPLCLVVENMSYEDFMVRTVFMPEKIDALLDRAAELIYTWLESVLAAGFGPVFRIFGPEYAAPPVMSLKHFKKFVTAYDRPLIELIHRHGGYVRYHCHGPIRRILDEFLSLGVDLTDPCEGPPSGDITLRELADRVGRDLILMGNIQLDDIERAEPDKIDRLVAEADRRRGRPRAVHPVHHGVPVLLAAGSGDRSQPDAVSRRGAEVRRRVVWLNSHFTQGGKYVSPNS